MLQIAWTFHPKLPVLVNRENAAGLVGSTRAMAVLDRVNAMDIKSTKPWLDDCIRALRDL